MSHHRPAGLQPHPSQAGSVIGQLRPVPGPPGSTPSHLCGHLPCSCPHKPATKLTFSPSGWRGRGSQGGGGVTSCSRWSHCVSVAAPSGLEVMYMYSSSRRHPSGKVSTSRSESPTSAGALRAQPVPAPPLPLTRAGAELRCQRLVVCQEGQELHCQQHARQGDVWAEAPWQQREHTLEPEMQAQRLAPPPTPQLTSTSRPREQEAHAGRADRPGSEAGQPPPGRERVGTAPLGCCGRGSLAARCHQEAAASLAWPTGPSSSGLSSQVGADVNTGEERALAHTQAWPGSRSDGHGLGSGWVSCPLLTKDHPCPCRCEKVRTG